MIKLILIYIAVFIAGIIMGVIIDSAHELVKFKGGTLDLATGKAYVNDWVFDTKDERTFVILHINGKEKKK